MNGVQVEEIYDLNKPLESPVYGFIFLFRWEERRARRKLAEQTNDIFVKDEQVVNSIFFAQQIVPNSCATHALLSILLNCSNIDLGNTLNRLKTYTRDMTPENKGYAIGNTPELAFAHNAHSMPQARRRLDRNAVATTSTRIGIPLTTGRITCEAFHFVSFVPINGHLFELDGLKPFPMDHGTWAPNEDWTDKFRQLITNRIDISNGEQDIRFNLMAVVPDRRIAIQHKLKILKTNKEIVSAALQKMVATSNGIKQELLEDNSSDLITSINLSSNNFSKELANLAFSGSSDSSSSCDKVNGEDQFVSCPSVIVKHESAPITPSTSQQFFESGAFPSRDLCTLVENLEIEIGVTQQHLDDENDKRQKYKVRICLLKVNCFNLIKIF